MSACKHKLKRLGKYFWCWKCGRLGKKEGSVIRWDSRQKQPGSPLGGILYFNDSEGDAREGVVIETITGDDFLNEEGFYVFCSNGETLFVEGDELGFLSADCVPFKMSVKRLKAESS